MSKAFELKATSATWQGVPPKFEWKFTFILIVSYFSHWIGNFPTKHLFAFFINWGLAIGFIQLLSATKVNKELHVVLFIFFRYNGGSDTKVWGQLDKFHIFGQFTLAFHLPEILIVLLSIFGIGDFDHVLVEETHELWFFHRLFYLFELITSHVFQLEIGWILWRGSWFHLVLQRLKVWNL